MSAVAITARISSDLKKSRFKRDAILSMHKIVIATNSKLIMNVINRDAQNEAAFSSWLTWMFLNKNWKEPNVNMYIRKADSVSKRDRTPNSSIESVLEK